MPAEAQPSRHVFALDGLRALMIIAIVCYHLNLPFLPSGHLGVVIFLVLTGYLTTSSLLKQFGRSGAVDRGRTLLRRFQRIWPSLAVLVVAVCALCLTLNRVLFTKLRPDALPSLLYALNWSYVLRDVSYFDALGTPSPLLHLWYIALSEQFVLIWTLIAPVLFKSGRKASAAVTLGLATVSAVLMAVLYVPGEDPSRVYYGLDTRAFSLLIGAALAFVWPVWRHAPFVRKSKQDLRRQLEGNPVLAWLGVLCLVLLVVAMVLLPADSALLYRGGMVLVSVLGVGIIAGCLAFGGPLSRVLSFPPLTMLGERAFALYLWHYPVISLLGASQSKVEWWVKPAAVVISLVAAELSLRLVERPFGELGGAGGETRSHRNTRRALVAVVSLATAGLTAYSAWGFFTAEDEFLVPQEAITSTGVGAGEAAVVAKPATPSADAQPAVPAEPVISTEPLPETITTIYASMDEQTAGLYDPLLIGDSVPGDAELVALFYNGIVDTYIGRRPDQALEVLQGYLEQGIVGNTVIFAAFSNTTPMPETLEAMVEAAGPARTVYLVGVVEPEGFQDQANENLRVCADAHDNVEFIDWEEVCAGHEDEYLYGDKTHLNEVGSPIYTQMIARAVAEHMRSYGCVVE